MLSENIFIYFKPLYLQIKNGTFSWDYKNKTLDNINIEFPAGEAVHYI